MGAGSRIDEPIAIEACEERVTKFGDDLVTLQVLSLLYLEVGRLDEGIALIRKTNDMLGHNPYGYRMLALALADQGRFPEAVEAMQIAVEQEPGDEQLAADLAALRQAAGS